MDLSQDFSDLLTALENSGAEYLLIGGYAVAVHAAPRYTKDIDIWVGASEDNLARVAEALREFGAPRAAIQDVLSGRDDEIVWFGNPPGRVDVLKSIPGVAFDEAYRNGSKVTLGASVVMVISREHLIEAKLAAGRPQDLLDVAALREVGV